MREDREAILELAASIPFDEAFHRANNDDFQNFCEEDYLRLFDIVNECFNNQELRTSEDLPTLINDCREAVIDLVHEDKRFELSSLRKWAMATLDKMEACPKTASAEGAKKMLKYRKKECTRKRMRTNKNKIGISPKHHKKNEADINKAKAVNKRIIALFDKYKQNHNLDGFLEGLLSFIRQNEDSIYPINVSTSLHRIGRAGKSRGRRVEFSEYQMSTIYSIFEVLTSRIETSKTIMDGQSIGCALYGFQGVGDSEEVRAVLGALAKKIEESKCEIDTQAIGNALYGLQSVGDSEEVRAVLGALAKKIAKSRCEISEQAIGNALYGLQGVGDSEEVRAVLGALAKKIEASGCVLNAQTVGNGLYGLFGVKDIPHAQVIIQRLLGALDSLKSTAIIPTDIRYIVQALHLHEIPIPVWLEEQYNALSGSRKNIPNHNGERKVFQILKKRYPNEAIEMNVLIDGFELDFYFCDKNMNIELDGPQHDKPIKKRRDRIRDKHLLEKRGIKTIRISTMREKVKEVLRRLDMT